MALSRLEAALTALWFTRRPGPLQRLMRRALRPLSWLVEAVARRRLRRRHANDPGEPQVVVIGNLVAGGAGKTPLTLACAHALSVAGFSTGLLARGFAAARRDARVVRFDDDAAAHGDEPVLLARESGLPVAAGARRADALALLCATHPELQVVLSDDGLQHFALPRRLEIAVFDTRGAGNGQVLPAGPLREPLDRLFTVDAIVLNGEDARLPALPPDPRPLPPVFRSRIEARQFRRLSDGLQVPAGDFREWLSREGHPRVTALAGIADPQRFVRQLRTLGVDCALVAPGDHAALDERSRAALPDGILVMTTKDAVKWAHPGDGRSWTLEVEACPEPAFLSWLLEQLRGQPTA